ncbi:hypothetical protein COBT_001841, partial [Conglomerata obtusa]
MKKHQTNKPFTNVFILFLCINKYRLSNVQDIITVYEDPFNFYTCTNISYGLDVYLKREIRQRKSFLIEFNGLFLDNMKYYDNLHVNLYVENKEAHICRTYLEDFNSVFFIFKKQFINVVKSHMLHLKYLFDKDGHVYYMYSNIFNLNFTEFYLMKLYAHYKTKFIKFISKTYDQGNKESSDTIRWNDIYLQDIKNKGKTIILEYINQIEALNIWIQKHSIISNNLHPVCKTIFSEYIKAWEYVHFRHDIVNDNTEKSRPNHADFPDFFYFKMSLQREDQDSVQLLHNINELRYNLIDLDTSISTKQEINIEYVIKTLIRPKCAFVVELMTEFRFKKSIFENIKHYRNFAVTMNNYYTFISTEMYLHEKSLLIEIYIKNLDTSIKNLIDVFDQILFYGLKLYILRLSSSTSILINTITQFEESFREVSGKCAKKIIFLIENYTNEEEDVNSYLLKDIKNMRQNLNVIRSTNAILENFIFAIALNMYEQKLKYPIYFLLYKKYIKDVKICISDLTAIKRFEDTGYKNYLINKTEMIYNKKKEYFRMLKKHFFWEFDDCLAMYIKENVLLTPENITFINWNRK